MRVLVLEDDPELGPVIVSRLRDAGFAVDLALTLADADFRLSVNDFDCVVADRMVPDGDSLTLLAAQRRAGSTVPFLLLTALDTVADRVAGFEHGSDDYLVKPFAFAELTARVRTLCRRAQPTRLPQLRAGDVEMDLPRRRVRRAGILLSLTAKEFAVLEVLELTPLRLDQLVELTVEEMPDREGIQVSTEPVVVLGDPELLAQAVRNLVENALRHGRARPGAAPRPVEVTVAPTFIAVRDHGPGVPAADHEKVFARGVTGGSGTGTGLAIVRWVADLHGATAQLTDAPGGGLRAQLLLPPHAAR
ncbi:ATP-binding protein [Kitasatospora sp. NBC_00374]|uniref:hybrid sensor histidine kinase/response regulator n=1 Tax=Kitasatospora sp. NBC_00374 TaxID=2975964 RepID=UPI0030E5868A